MQYIRTPLICMIFIVGTVFAISTIHRQKNGECDQHAPTSLNLELIMKVLGNIAVIILVIIGVLALIPLVSFGFAIFGGITVFAIWLLPVWIIATSDQTTGFEKIAWIIAILCLSWFAWVFYFFLAPLKPKQRYYY